MLLRWQGKSFKPAKNALSTRVITKSPSLAPKGTNHPSGIQPHPSGASKTYTKQTASKKYVDLPVLAKQLIQNAKPKNA